MQKASSLTQVEIPVQVDLAEKVHVWGPVEYRQGGVVEPRLLLLITPTYVKSATQQTGNTHRNISL